MNKKYIIPAEEKRILWPESESELDWERSWALELLSDGQIKGVIIHYDVDIEDSSTVVFFDDRQWTHRDYLDNNKITGGPDAATPIHRLVYKDLIGGKLEKYRVNRFPWDKEEDNGQRRLF